MNDRDALLRAAAAAPADDLPRLVYADWLEEHDDPDRAAFVRAQCALATTPPWEPFAVRCRARHPDWLTGEPWRDGLPPVDGRLLEWHPERPFRRGLGYALVVRQLGVLLDVAPRLFDLAPIGELHLPTATLDEWRRFARQPWLARVRSVHFYGTVTPVEPVRVLCDAPLASGIEEIVFEATSRPGMPDVLAGLLAAPLGRGLKTLRLAAGPDDTHDLVSALCDPFPPPTPVTLGFRAIPFNQSEMLRLTDAPISRDVLTLHLTDVPSGHAALLRLTAGPRRPLAELRLTRCGVGGEVLVRIANTETLGSLRALVLHPTGGYDAELHSSVARSATLAGLRTLTLARCGFGRMAVQTLVRSRFWPRLVELDLRHNHLTDAAADGLIAAPLPPDLTALWLGGNPITDVAIHRLRDHFGEAVSFDVGDTGTGLR